MRRDGFVAVLVPVFVPVFVPVVVLVVAVAVLATCRICVAAPAVTAIVLEAKDEGSANVSAARATIDGAQVVETLDGTAIPVKPGAHRAVFAAAGFRSIETTFVVAEGQKLRVVVFLSAAGAAPGGLELSAAPAPRERDEPASGGSPRRTLGLALAGAGLAGLVVGTVWSLRSKSTYDEALSSECAGDANHCSPRGIADGQTAHRQAGIATIGFIAGGVLLAAGATLYITGPRRTGLAVAPAPDGGGSVLLAGAW
jgi:serine/threonine-protein kinase